MDEQLTQAKSILDFLFNLQWKSKLPSGVTVLNPYANPLVRTVCTEFYQRYYNDTHPRWLICGINPGRFGGGLTGIPFTDSTQIKAVTGLDFPYHSRQELSATYIHQMIERFGGYEKFYGIFHFTSVSPLGFTKNDKNLNYYDLPVLKKTTLPFAVECFRKQLDSGIANDLIFCLGEGENLKFLKELNDKYRLFGKIVPLTHPRFIMQYKRRMLDEYINDYIYKLTF